MMFLIFQTAASRGDPYSYKVENVGGHHAGFYTCVAGNSYGEAESSAYLEVNKGGRLEVSSFLQMMTLLTIFLCFTRNDFVKSTVSDTART